MTDPWEEQERHEMQAEWEDAIEAENARLRELVRDTLTTISWCTIDCCPSDSKKRELYERARELGIEVYA